MGLSLGGVKHLYLYLSRPQPAVLAACSTSTAMGSSASEAFENHARVLQLSSAYPAVAGASLLIANNNRSLPAQLLEQWVRSQLSLIHI